jgi:hypothetical protein
MLSYKGLFLKNLNCYGKNYKEDKLIYFILREMILNGSDPALSRI